MIGTNTTKDSPAEPQGFSNTAVESANWKDT